MTAFSEMTPIQVRGVIPRGHPAIENETEILPREAFRRLLELAEDSAILRRRVATFLTEEHPLALAAKDMSVHEILIFLIGYTQYGKIQVLSPPEQTRRSEPTSTPAVTPVPVPGRGNLNHGASENASIELDEEDLALYTEVPKFG